MDQITRLADDAYRSFIKFLATIQPSDDLNEDTTRTRWIDTILFEILRWDKHTQVETERYIRAEGYADYVFSTRGTLSMVLEAKKSGTTFVLPDRPYPDRAVPFSLIADQCPDAYNAMHQAVNYANSLGIRYTAISNGKQWLLMLTNMEGVPLKDRNVIVFESLNAVWKRFPRFWDAFSAVSIGANLPRTYLVDKRNIPAPAKLKATIIDYPVPRTMETVRNKHGTALQLIWDEITSTEGTPAFFQECYVVPSSASKSETLAKELLVQRREVDSLSAPQVNSQNDLKQMVITYQAEKPVVLLGRIGRGKSTFIKYLKTVVAPKELDKYIQLDIYFIERPQKAEDVADYVYAEIARQLCDRYKVDIFENKFTRAVLHGAINRFKKTPRAIAYVNTPQYLEYELEFIESETKKNHEYLVQCFQHLKGARQQSIALFFDNLDKRGDKIQEEAFLIASSLARECGALVFVCLRPGTFYRSREFGVLDSIAPRIIHIQPPPLSLFLKRRFEYGNAIATGVKPPPRGDKTVLSKTIAMQAQDVAKLFKALAESAKEGRDLVDVFESVANGNLRDVQSYVRDVITSGHLNTNEILDAIEETGGYFVAEHQALRAILFGDCKYYDPEKPPFINLFDIRNSDPIEHFARPICLHILDQVSEGSAFAGFLPYDELAAKLSTYTFAPSLTEETATFLFKRKCIEDELQSEEWAGVEAKYRITTLGRYHLGQLMAKFLYLDAITPDIPIIDEDIRRQVRDVSQLSQRLSRTHIVLRYLNKCAEQLLNTSFYSHWDQCHQRMMEEMSIVQTKQREDV